MLDLTNKMTAVYDGIIGEPALDEAISKCSSRLTTSHCIEDCLSGTISQRQALSPVERLKRKATSAFEKMFERRETGPR